MKKILMTLVLAPVMAMAGESAAGWGMSMPGWRPIARIAHGTPVQSSRMRSMSM